mmetsp:Transcript_647/g.2171  ORF Transcript_647/g.2171 Transcript_647/m.2171 type:complete len:272 (+) Transcript_647:497-1312(+)
MPAKPHAGRAMHRLHRFVVELLRLPGGLRVRSVLPCDVAVKRDLELLPHDRQRQLREVGRADINQRRTSIADRCSDHHRDVHRSQDAEEAMHFLRSRMDRLRVDAEAWLGERRQAHRARHGDAQDDAGGRTHRSHREDDAVRVRRLALPYLLGQLEQHAALRYHAGDAHPARRDDPWAIRILSHRRAEHHRPTADEKAPGARERERREVVECVVHLRDVRHRGHPGESGCRHTTACGMYLRRENHVRARGSHRDQTRPFVEAATGLAEGLV